MNYDEIVELVEEYKETDKYNINYCYRQDCDCTNPILYYIVDIDMLWLTCERHFEDFSDGDYTLLDEKDSFLIKLLLNQ